MKFHLAIFLAASELLVLLQCTHGLLMQPSKNHHRHLAKTDDSSNILARPSGPSKSRSSVLEYLSSPLLPYSKSAAYTFALHAEARDDDRISKAGGGVPKVPTGELNLFDPGEQGMKGGTMDLAERLKSGISYHQAEASVETSNEASLQPEPELEPELSLFDPGQEGMKGGTSDFAERLKGGVNFHQAQDSEQQFEAPLQVNGAAPSAPEPVVAPAVETSSQAAPPPAPEHKPTGQRAYWPYRPMVASSSPTAYPNVGVGRGRAAAIQRRYRDAIDASSVPRTTAAAVQSHPAKIVAVNGATSNGAASDDSEQAARAENAQRQNEAQNTAINNNFWGKQSNWWDAY